MGWGCGVQRTAGHRSKGSLRSCSISGPAWHLLSQALPHPWHTLKQLMLRMALLGSEEGAHQGFGVLGPPQGLWWGSQCLAQEVFVFSSVASRALWEDRARATNTTWQLTLTPLPQDYQLRVPPPLWVETKPVFLRRCAGCYNWGGCNKFFYNCIIYI